MGPCVLILIVLDDALRDAGNETIRPLNMAS